MIERNAPTRDLIHKYLKHQLEEFCFRDSISITF